MVPFHTDWSYFCSYNQYHVPDDPTQYQGVTMRELMADQAEHNRPEGDMIESYV